MDLRPAKNGRDSARLHALRAHVDLQSKLKKGQEIMPDSAAASSFTRAAHSTRALVPNLPIGNALVPESPIRKP